MTTFMKLEAVLYLILKILKHACGWIGALGIIGFVGGLEHELITFKQFFLYEINACVLVGLCYVMYRLEKEVRADFIKRNRAMKRSLKNI
jgi:hypothetical protein